MCFLHLYKNKFINHFLCIQSLGLADILLVGGNGSFGVVLFGAFL